MGHQRGWDDEFTLLCERCGYVVEGLDPGAACPECGRPIAESLPERRVGSPWQQEPGRRALLLTWWRTLAHPIRTLDDARIGDDVPSIRRRAVIVASAIGGASWVIGIGLQCVTMNVKFELPDRLWTWFRLGLGGGFAWFLLLTALLFAMTKTEELGLRVLGKRRGFRLTPGVSRAICDLGSVGWVLASLGGAIAALCVASLEAVPNRMLPVWAYVTVPIAALPGFLFFETFAWLGLRRLRFANRVRPSPPDTEAPPRSVDA